MLNKVFCITIPVTVEAIATRVLALGANLTLSTVPYSLPTQPFIPLRILSRDSANPGCNLHVTHL